MPTENPSQSGLIPAEAIERPETADAELSATMRDYLAEIYRLSDRARDYGGGDGFIGTSVLAELLDVSPPAVNRMVTRLRELGYLRHEPYQGIQLTSSGEREALKQLRRQRLVEAFLVTVMKFGWHEVHPEALRMARALPDVLAARMAQMAGEPRYCPHGEPIPAADGTIELPDDALITEAPHGQPMTISRVRTHERDRLEYLAALGLVPGAAVEIIHAAPFNGPLQLRVGREYRIIGHNLAEILKVVPG